MPMVTLPVCRRTLSALLQRGMPVLSVNTVIALCLTAFGNSDFAANLVYSYCIGISIWLLIEVAQTWLLPDPKQQWKRLYLLIPVCIALGYVVGLYLAAWLLNHQARGIWSEQPRLLLGYLLISLAAGGTLSYYFMSREQLTNAREAIAKTQAQNEAAQRHAAESKLLLLQTQLEPHMLFNTLANLRALIGVDPVRAQAMLDHLVAYLRATLSASRSTSHTLRAEFDRLQDYLELMSVRMGPRLHYTLDLPVALAGLPMPPLLLQPLVENAIKHGLEPKPTGGSITVRARHTAHQMMLEVLDTGVGLPIDAALPEGFGLVQVRERLVPAFGPRGAIELVAGDAGGTAARVTFPCV